MDRGGWWAIVHRVTKSWRQLKRLSTHTHTHTHTHTLDKETTEKRSGPRRGQHHSYLWQDKTGWGHMSSGRVLFFNLVQKHRVDTLIRSQVYFKQSSVAVFLNDFYKAVVLRRNRETEQCGAVCAV